MSEIITRRALVAGFAGLAILPSFSLAQERKTPKHLIAEVLVFPWLSVGRSTGVSVRASVQSIVTSSPGTIFRDGASDITGGTFMSLSSVTKAGLLGEKGLRVLSIVFDTKDKAQLAMFLVDRGWNDANVNPVIQRITNRYSHLASPVKIQDEQSEATDMYLFFDLGRFAIEIAIPQHGSMLQVTFTTKDLHRNMRMADGTYQLFQSTIEKQDAIG